MQNTRLTPYPRSGRPPPEHPPPSFPPTFLLRDVAWPHPSQFLPPGDPPLGYVYWLFIGSYKAELPPHPIPKLFRLWRFRDNDVFHQHFVEQLD